MEDIGTMLNEEYQRTLEAVSQAVTGTEEAKWQLQKLCELHKQRMSEKEAEDSVYIHYEELQIKKKELEMKEAVVKEGKTDRIVKIALDSAAILVPAIFSGYWMAKGLTFEKDGTFTSRSASWLSSHIRLFRK